MSEINKRRGLACLCESGHAFLLCTRLWLKLPDNKRSLRVIHLPGLPYIEDRMHTDLNHGFFALSREAYFNQHGAARKKA